MCRNSGGILPNTAVYSKRGHSVWLRTAQPTAERVFTLVRIPRTVHCRAYIHPLVSSLHPLVYSCPPAGVQSYTPWRVYSYPLKKVRLPSSLPPWALRGTSNYPLTYLYPPARPPRRPAGEGTFTRQRTTMTLQPGCIHPLAYSGCPSAMVLKAPPDGSVYPQAYVCPPASVQ